VTRSLHEGGYALTFTNFGFLYHIINIFCDVSTLLDGFSPFLEDLELFLRPDPRGFLPTSSLYKPKVLENLGRGSEKENIEELLNQRHFYVGNLLRRAPLRAISRSFVHPFSVLSILMGS
jgi:hypothetical protein